MVGYDCRYGLWSKVVVLFAPAAAPNAIVWTSIPNIGVARGTQELIQFVSRELIRRNMKVWGWQLCAKWQLGIHLGAFLCWSLECNIGNKLDTQHDRRHPQVSLAVWLTMDHGEKLMTAQVIIYCQPSMVGGWLEPVRCLTKFNTKWWANEQLIGGRALATKHSCWSSPVQAALDACKSCKNHEAPIRLE